MERINIAQDFTVTPGPRYIKQGEKSGEEFRKEILEPAYVKAKNNHEILTIILDGTYGYFDSFLEEAFGGLKRDYPADDILTYIAFVSEEDGDYIDKIQKFVKDALSKK